MWNTQRSLKNERAAVIAEYYEDYRDRTGRGDRKLSRTMAMILGIAVTLEIMIAGAMIFNLDFHGADGIALIFVFMVLYFGVVAALTDK